MPFIDNDFVIYKENGKMQSAGFTVNSIMLQKGITPIIAGGGSRTTTDANADSAFSNLAIPAGLYYFDGGFLDQRGGNAKNATYINEDKHISDDLYTKLLGLVGGDVKESDDDDVVKDGDKNNSTMIGGKKGHKKTKRHKDGKHRTKTHRHSSPG